MDYAVRLALSRDRATFALAGLGAWRIAHPMIPDAETLGMRRPSTLTSHEVIVQTIAATTTRTGLRVQAELDTNIYPTGVKIPDDDMKALDSQGIMTRHDFHGEWNSTLKPPDRDTPIPIPDQTQLIADP